MVDTKDLRHQRSLEATLDNSSSEIPNALGKFRKYLQELDRNEGGQKAKRVKELDLNFVLVDLAKDVNLKEIKEEFFSEKPGYKLYLPKSGSLRNEIVSMLEKPASGGANSEIITALKKAQKEVIDRVREEHEEWITEMIDNGELKDWSTADLKPIN